MSPGSNEFSDSHRRRKRYRGTHPRRFDEKYKELEADQHPDIIEQVRARGGTPAGTHVPILVQEVMEALQPRPGDVVADCTLGYGGHAGEFLRQIGPTGRLIAFDLDAGQLERSGARLRAQFPDHQIDLHHGNYAGLDKGLPSNAGDISGYDIIFADLGLSSMQVDDPARGFTYKHDGPLDMRMDPARGRTAAELLECLSEEKLAAALADLADEPDAVRMAQAIVERRGHEPIQGTRQLVQLIFSVKQLSPRHWRTELTERQGLPQSKVPLGTSPGKGSHRLLHPAARTFQALRILVNDELGSLAQLLRVAPYCLAPRGRLGLITFHSGEDRRVAECFDRHRAEGVYSRICTEPLRPSAREKAENLRSRSARFRWAERCLMP